jgi:hypothetical protein
VSLFGGSRRIGERSGDRWRCCGSALYDVVGCTAVERREIGDDSQFTDGALQDMHGQVCAKCGSPHISGRCVGVTAVAARM